MTRGGRELIRATVVVALATLVAATVAALPGNARYGRATKDARPAGYVQVDGHKMYCECVGTGEPTVVLDAGSPDTSATWRWIQPALAADTRVCAYDRAGLGKSAPALPGHRTPKTQVHELRELLRGARIPPPYIVVGHSWGGFLARLFAFTYPRQTAGVVLVDATTFPYLTPAALARIPRKTTKEGIDIEAAVAESAAIKSLGQLPLIVLGSNRPPLNAKFLKAQADEAALSTNSINAIARNSTHYIQRPAPLGQPQVVITAVEAVIRAARTHRALPGCRNLFHGSAVTCRRG